MRPISILALLMPLMIPLAGAPRAGAADGYEREAVIEGPAKLVWGLLTTEDGIKSWLASQAKIDLRVGGLVRVHQSPEGRIGDPQTVVSRVLLLEPGRRFTFKLLQTPQGYPMANYLEGTSYDVFLDPLPGNKTRLRCVGNGLAGGFAAYAIRPVFHQGLDVVFDHLQQAVAAAMEKKPKK